VATRPAHTVVPSKAAKQSISTVLGSGKLTYHGGPIEHNPNVWLIFWGPNWTSDSALIAARNVVTTMFADLGHTRYENTLSQYYGTNGWISNSLTSNAIIDSSVPPSETTNCGVAAVDDSSLQAEVNSLISMRGLPHNDGNTTYLVFTELYENLIVPPLRVPFEIWDPTYGCSAPGSGNYCGYHSFDTTVNQAYAAIPYPDLGSSPGCGTQVDPNGSPEGDALANTAAHEEANSATDPSGTGWFDSAGFEIGDKCNFISNDVNLNNGGWFFIVTLYSNASGECVNAYAPDTVGAYIPGSPSFFCLRTFIHGGCDVGVHFGTSGDIPVVGDWTGKGYDSIGVYIPGSPSYFCLRNANAPGGCDSVIPFGTSGDIPVVGDWTGKGYDSIGVYIPQYGFFCLRNSNTPGPCDISFTFGGSGDVPVVGDWFDQGFNTVGVWIPQYGFFCILRNANTTGGCSIATNFGGPGDIPLAGDTTDFLNEGSTQNAKFDTIGVYIPSNGYFCLRNSNVTGPCDVATQFGSGADIPLLGHWVDEGAGYERE
jgi:hypothetical protein